MQRSALDLDPLVRHAVGHGEPLHVARAVLAEVGHPLQLSVGQRLGGQRLQVPYVVGPDAQTLADPEAELSGDAAGAQS